MGVNLTQIFENPFFSNGVNLTQISEKPFYKGLEAGEVECFNLSPTSPEPHFYLMQP